MAWRIPFIHRKPSEEHDADVLEASRDSLVRLDALRDEMERAKDRADAQADTERPSSHAD